MSMEILGTASLPAGRPAAVFAAGTTHVFAIGAGGMMYRWSSADGLDWRGPDAAARRDQPGTFLPVRDRGRERHPCLRGRPRGPLRERRAAGAVVVGRRHELPATGYGERTRLRDPRRRQRNRGLRGERDPRLRAHGRRLRPLLVHRDGDARPAGVLSPLRRPAALRSGRGVLYGGRPHPRVHGGGRRHRPRLVQQRRPGLVPVRASPPGGRAERAAGPHRLRRRVTGTGPGGGVRRHDRRPARPLVAGRRRGRPRGRDPPLSAAQREHHGGGRGRRPDRGLRHWR